MIEIGKTIVSLDLIEKNFVCDISVCKGYCCVHGDSGAPLEKEEQKLLEKEYNKISAFMQQSGIDVVTKNGVAVTDSDGDLVTPLIDGNECAFAFFEGGVAKCAIEKAWAEKHIAIRKPVSCWLYPVRIISYKDFDAVSYHRWDICKCAIDKGNKLKAPLFEFLKAPLQQKYGNDWFTELEIAANLYNKENIREK